jgi:carboxyl-terminal processing protease
VASVLKEHRKAEVMGRKTFGLAATQKFLPLEDGSGLVLTSAVFQPALGKKLWYTGVTPSIQIEGDADSKSYIEQTYKAIADN